MSYCPENQLESALRLAADKPAHRPDFLRVLLDSTILVMGETGATPDGKGVIAAGEKLPIANWTRADGSPVIPFFSSVSAMQQAIDRETTCLHLPARSLFEMTKGTALVLNPKSGFGKEFLPKEIEALLTHGADVPPEPHVVTKSARVLLGVPTTTPTEMLDALATLLSGCGNVKAAYLALIHDPSRDDEPNLIVGIEADGDVKAILREAGLVAHRTAPSGERVDLFEITRGERGISTFFVKEVKPFYERNWRRKLRFRLGLG